MERVGISLIRLIIRQNINRKAPTIGRQPTGGVMCYTIPQLGPSDLLTSERLGTRRLRVDVGQTGFFERREFISSTGNKYATVLLSLRQADELLTSMAPTPRQLTVDGSEFAILRLEPHLVQQFIDHIGGDVSVGFSLDKPSLLTHQMAIDLLSEKE